MSSIEAPFFDWLDWDEAGGASLMFYNCTFKQDLGRFRAGENVFLIEWITDESRMLVYITETDLKSGVYHEFKMRVVLSPVIDLTSTSDNED